jgi:hypothetical protein
MKGLLAISSKAPHEIKELINKEINETRAVAKVECAEKSGLSYDLCEAKLFIELNPEILEALLIGNWAGVLEKFKRVTG